jgi:hypothetical protein
MIYKFTGFIQIEADDNANIDLEHLKAHLHELIVLDLNTEDAVEFDQGDVVGVELDWQTLEKC